MTPNTLQDPTRRLNQNHEDGFAPLDIADVMTEHGNAMVSVWTPTAEEIAKIMKGEPVVLMIVGARMPPVAIGVGLDFTP
jgi:hypothetical protein